MWPSTRRCRTPARTVRFARILARGVAAVALVAASCSGERSPALPEEFLGQWYYTGSSGGLTGRGLGDAASGYIVIRADGALERHEEGGTLADTTRFTAGRGKTIFSEDDLWILEAEGEPSQVVRLSADGRTLTLAENVYDGWSRAYARSR